MVKILIAANNVHHLHPLQIDRAVRICPVRVDVN